MITMEEAGALNCRDLFFFCHSLVMTFSVSSDGRGGVIGYLLPYETKDNVTSITPTGVFLEFVVQ